MNNTALHNSHNLPS